jgi:hypothetical protein
MGSTPIIPAIVPSPFMRAWRNWQTLSIWDRLAVFRLASSTLVARTTPFYHFKNFTSTLILYLTQGLRYV